MAMQTLVTVSPADVGQLLDEIRRAFAHKHTDSGIHLIERALLLKVEWEALTDAVGQGIAARA